MTGRNAIPNRETGDLFDQMFHRSAAIKLLVEPGSGRIRDANEAAARFYGYSIRELCNLGVTDLNILPLEHVQQEMEAARREQRNQFRFRHRLANGAIRDVEVCSSPLNLQGETLLLSIIHDVTARNDYEQELAVLRDIADNLPVGIYRSELSGSGRFLSFNREMLRIAEAENAAQLANTPVQQLYANPEDRDDFISRLMDSLDWHSQTILLRSLKGKTGLYRITVRKQYDQEGRACVDGILEDINQIHAIEKSRQHLYEIIDATPAIVGISNAEGRLMYLNQAGREVLGLGPEDPLDRYEARKVHTESSFRTLVRDALPEAMEKGHWSGEMCFRTEDGSHIPVQTTLIAHRDDQGEVLRVSAVSIDVSAQKRRQQALEQMAYRDSLTGVLNRRGFMQALREAVGEARIRNEALSLLMLDLDDFKPINDRHGHPVGDEILRRLAPVLSDGRRRDDYVGRLGGEEFGITLPGADAEAARQVAEQIRQRLAHAPIETHAGEIPVTASIGVATLEDAQEQGESLLRRADEALYEAKRAGKNCVRSR